jgi:hypothetical protein
MITLYTKIQLIIIIIICIILVISYWYYKNHTYDTELIKHIIGIDWRGGNDKYSIVYELKYPLPINYEDKYKLVQLRSFPRGEDTKTIIDALRNYKTTYTISPNRNKICIVTYPIELGDGVSPVKIYAKGDATIIFET